ncbi:DUF3617 domain-containing protein [Phenylobacterium ferrooxidans]|uniref:DUF3617 family protein n=1 Tax=Phenylobacterium ferrooxidans TaxID=2982689 RepID=A0ABW6CI31_9CAUL
MRIWIAAVLALTLSACDRLSGGPDSLRPGRWAFDYSMPGTEGRHYTKCLVGRRRIEPAREQIRGLSVIIPDDCSDESLQIVDGKISGALARCAGTGGISNYKLRVHGTYSHNKFSVTTEMPIVGTVVSQRLNGRRIGSCPESQLPGIWQEDRHRKLSARERKVLTGPATLP